MKLEEELSYRIIHHKFNVIANYILNEIKNEELAHSNGVDIPPFIKQASDEQMERQLFNMLKDLYKFEREKFDTIYEMYYNKIAEVITGSETFGL